MNLKREETVRSVAIKDCSSCSHERVKIVLAPDIQRVDRAI